MLIPFENKQIYVECHGEGAPIVMLNGIMMSTRSWKPFVKSLSANNRLILFDFFDQGQSDRHPEQYDLDLQVDALCALFGHLGLSQAVVCGISYGGSVALKFAVRHPEQVGRLILFNSTARTGEWLKTLGDGWIKNVQDPEAFYLATIPIIYSQDFYNRRSTWTRARRDFLVEQVFTNNNFMEGLTRLIKSAESYDIISEIGAITAKTLIVASQQDAITPTCCQEDLHRLIKGSELVLLPGVGHATMYETPALFASLLLGFANAHLDEISVS